MSAETQEAESAKVPLWNDPNVRSLVAQVTLVALVIWVFWAIIQNTLINLEKQNIETRRLWKPLHMHSAYYDFEFVGAGQCEQLFEKGICLPSGTGLSDSDQNRVIESIKSFFED